MTEASRIERVWDAITARADALGVPVSLRVLCETAADRLPITGVAVAIRGGFVASELICVTDALSRRLEELQLTIGEGPTLDVLAGSSAIQVEDLDAPGYQKRWPLFAPRLSTPASERCTCCPCALVAFAAGPWPSTPTVQPGCRAKPWPRRGCLPSWP